MAYLLLISTSLLNLPKNDSPPAFGKLHCPFLRLVVAEPTCDAHQEKASFLGISHLCIFFKYYREGFETAALTNIVGAAAAAAANVASAAIE